MSKKDPRRIEFTCDWEETGDTDILHLTMNHDQALWALRRIAEELPFRDPVSISLYGWLEDKGPR